MGDLYIELQKQRKTASRMEKMTYDALENRLRMYVKGSLILLTDKQVLILKRFDLF